MSNSSKIAKDISIGTVESPKTDTPRSGQPLYNGQTSWNGINLPRI